MIEVGSSFRIKGKYFYAHYKSSDFLSSELLSYNITHCKCHLSHFLPFCGNWGSGNKRKTVDTLANAIALRGQDVCLWSLLPASIENCDSLTCYLANRVKSKVCKILDIYLLRYRVLSR